MCTGHDSSSVHPKEGERRKRDEGEEKKKEERGRKENVQEKTAEDVKDDGRGGGGERRETER